MKTFRLRCKSDFLKPIVVSSAGRCLITAILADEEINITLSHGTYAHLFV